jgi:hypothetical protein
VAPGGRFSYRDGSSAANEKKLLSWQRLSSLPRPAPDGGRFVLRGAVIFLPFRLGTGLLVFGRPRSVLVTGRFIAAGPGRRLRPELTDRRELPCRAKTARDSKIPVSRPGPQTQTPTCRVPRLRRDQPPLPDKGVRASGDPSRSLVESDENTEAGRERERRLPRRRGRLQQCPLQVWGPDRPPSSSTSSG